MSASTTGTKNMHLGRYSRHRHVPISPATSTRQKSNHGLNEHGGTTLLKVSTLASAGSMVGSTPLLLLVQLKLHAALQACKLAIFFAAATCSPCNLPSFFLFELNTYSSSYGFSGGTELCKHHADFSQGLIQLIGKQHISAFRFSVLLPWPNSFLDDSVRALFPHRVPLLLGVDVKHSCPSLASDVGLAYRYESSSDSFGR